MSDVSWKWQRGLPSTRAERRVLPALSVLTDAAVAQLRSALRDVQDDYALEPVLDGSCVDAWTHAEPFFTAMPSEEGFRLYREIKSTLCCGDLEPSDDTLRAAFVFDGRVPNDIRLTALLGVSAAPCGRRLRQLVGIGRKSTVRPPPAEIEGLMGMLPIELAERFRIDAARDRVEPLKPLSQSICGRVMRLDGDRARRAGAIAILSAWSKGLSYATMTSDLALIERFAEMMVGRDHGDEDHVADVFSGYAAGKVMPQDPVHARLVTVVRLGPLLRRLRKEAGSHADLLPAWNEEASKHIKREARRRKKAAEAQRLWEKRHKGADLALRFADILRAAEDRCESFAAVHEGYLKARRAATTVDASTNVSFRVRGPILDMDGVRRGYDQVDHYRLVSEATLVSEAIAMRPGSDELARYARTLRRYAHRPDRLHVVYVASAAVGPTAEARPPWIIELLRLGLTDTGKNLPDGMVRERRQLAKQYGMPLAPPGIEGIMGNPRETLHFVRLLRRTLGENAPVIVSVEEIRHGLELARLLLRIALRWGARINEARQLRQGCITYEFVQKIEHAFAWLTPKNSDAPMRYLADSRTLECMLGVRDMIVDRFGADGTCSAGQPVLRTWPFGDIKRPTVQEGRFFFVNAFGPIRTEGLSFLVAVLMAGVVQMRVHDARYVLATLMQLMGADDDEIGATLHHAEGSAATPGYACGGLVESDGEVARYISLFTAERW